MAAITCFFNPCGWLNRTKNLIQFRQEFQGCDLFIIEASHDNNFVFSDSLHLHANDDNKYIWQKERMLNYLCEQLPGRYNKIAWIDGDVIFANPNWANETEELLDEYGAVQCFETVTYIDAEGNEGKTKDSIGKFGDGNAKLYHPGFAWATHRKNFPLFDLNISGGGDLCMCQWWLGEFGSWHHQKKSPAWKQSCHKHSLKFFQMTQGNISATSGKIFHLFHGSWEDRKYRQRTTDFAKLNFEPERDIVVDQNGLWRWTNSNQQLRDYMTKYLHGRKEDEQLARPFRR